MKKEIRDGKPTIEEIKKEYLEKADIMVSEGGLQKDDWSSELSKEAVWNFFERYLK